MLQHRLKHSIFIMQLGLDVRGLSRHNDLHKNKGHKSVLVRDYVQVSPSVMVAFGKTVIFHHHEQG